MSNIYDDLALNGSNLMFDIKSIKQSIIPKSRYIYQLDRIASEGKGTSCIETAVTGSVLNIQKNSTQILNSIKETLNQMLIPTLPQPL